MLGNRRNNGNGHAPAIAGLDNPVYEPAYLADTRTDAHLTEVVNTIHPMVMAFVDVDAVAEMQPTQLAIYLKPIVTEILEKSRINLSHAEQLNVEKKLLDEVLGLGPIESLLHDETVTDILINGPESVYVERHGVLQATNIHFRDHGHVMDMLTRIFARIGRRIDENNPFVDGRLPDGTRVNVIIPPLSPNGPTVSIRKFRRVEHTLAQMVTDGAMNKEMAEVLDIAVKSHLNILICGGSGAGKTTLLNTLSKEIDPNERIVTIEDIAELRLLQHHVVTLETRLPNVDGKGGISQRHLFVNALRMRPNRIIVGEIRGSEVFDMLQAMNTGHDGSISTIHASTAEEVPTRLIDMVQMTGFQYPPENIMRQIGDSISLIIEVNRDRYGKRRVRRITEVGEYANGRIQMQDLFKYVIAGEGEEGHFEKNSVTPRFTPRATEYGLGKRLQEIMNAGRH